ncbi:MAG: prepilin-type N-terminal cleavage/methylation domain-containing protein [Betaproteobacteria bacterium]
MNRTQYQRGFTLIELLIVIAIIAILSAMAVANYRDYITRSKLQEPAAVLSDLRAKLELYYLDNRHYGAAPACGIAMPAGGEAKYFTYTCNSTAANALGAQGYFIVAAGVPSAGMDHFILQIDQSNVRRTLDVQPGWALPSTACWVQNKSGAC